MLGSPGGLCRDAIGAGAVIGQFVVIDDEAAGQSRAPHFGERTRVNVEDARAIAALEMFVMAVICRLKTRFARRQK